MSLIDEAGEQVTAEAIKPNRILGAGMDTTKEEAVKILKKANENLSVKYDAIIWNKTHGPVSELVEAAVAKFTGVGGLIDGYANILKEVAMINPSAVYDVHSEAAILFTRAFSELPANSLVNTKVNFFGYPVLEVTARNAFAQAGGLNSNISFSAKWGDVVTSVFGSSNPFRITSGTTLGILQGVYPPHNLFGYLMEAYQ